MLCFAMSLTPTECQHLPPLLLSVAAAVTVQFHAWLKHIQDSSKNEWAHEAE